MGRIEQIREQLGIRKHAETLCNNPLGAIQKFESPFKQQDDDIEYLLSRLQIAEEALKLISEEFSVIRSMEIAQYALEQIQKE